MFHVTLDLKSIQARVFHNFASIILKLSHFKCILVTHNEHSITFLQLTDLLHMLQVSLAGIRPHKFIKEKESETRMKISGD